MNVKATTKNHKCPECGEWFGTATGLGSHRRNKHGVAGKTIRGGKWKLAPGESTFKCPDCGKRFEKAVSIGPHRLRAHGIDADGRPVKKKTFDCPDCGKKMKTAVVLGAHRRIAHGITGFSPAALRRERLENPASPPEIVASPTVCEICGFQAKTSQGLAVHKATHKEKFGEETIEPAIAETTPSQAITKASRNGHIQTEDDRATHHRLEAAATYAAGRVTQLLESLALELDVSFRSFAPLVLRTVGATSKVRL